MNNSSSNNINPLGNNPANIVPHDSSMRGYSVENSFYDSPYNMDFEYGYLNLMFNITAFAARTQDMFQSLENNLSGIIELQNERRRLDYETRQTRETRETRESSQNSNIRQPMSQSSNEPRTTTGPTTPITPPPITNRGLTDNINYLLGRRNIFDSSNNVLFSFLPRNVLLNPTTLSENIGGRTTRRNINGLTIQEIEDNTEIITYSSITTNQRLNTECPISRDPFNENSIVLRVKECRHCFIPFLLLLHLLLHLLQLLMLLLHPQIHFQIL